MKKNLTMLALLLSGFLSHGQQAVCSDTTIIKNIGVNESFELGFEDLPSAGYIWLPAENSGSDQVQITPVKKVLVDGYQPRGGKYITTYRYTPLSCGTFLFEYFYGRPWLNEKAKKCVLKIIAG
ncbi:MAG: hypothetical protein IPN08_03470 [Bacteroidales bacterium]|nr:hypothetical protein [Bacteroidales bacterium]